MKKAIAFGLFVISILIGATFVIVGTTTPSDFAVWAGMIIIALGTINLAFKIIVPETRPHVTLRVVEPKKIKKKKVAKKTNKTVKKKKKSAKKTRK